jgi:acetylornithine deacetylase/succinyl-diaminopimelate desuccinylase-like protein
MLNRMLAGACNLKAATLLSMWRRPNLSIHGVEGAHAGPGAKTVIPCSVTGKFSMRLAAGQDLDHVATKVQAHLRAKFETLGTEHHDGRLSRQGPSVWGQS